MSVTAKPNISTDATLERWLGTTETHVAPIKPNGKTPSLCGVDFKGSTLGLLKAKIEEAGRVLARNPADSITIGIAESGQCRGAAAKREIRLIPKRLAFILLPGEVLNLEVVSQQVSGLLLQVPATILLQECELHGTEAPDILSLQETIPGHEALILACAQQLLDLAGQHEGPAKSRLVQPLEASILSLVASLVGTTKRSSGVGNGSEPIQSAYVQAALAFMEDHLSETITLTDLCQVCCISARTLQIAFQTVTNRSPLQVLQELRFTRLRDLLLQRMDVRSACKQVGLQPTGRMAANYKRLFGELPRETKPQKTQ